MVNTMREPPLVSLIIPVYNTREYLETCIKSAIGQTYERIQIILVDDGSFDGSERICDDYQQFNNRIIAIHKTNGGPSSARECGIHHADGQYIMFIDSDDWIDPETVTECVKQAVAHNADCVAFSYVREYENATSEVHPVIAGNYYRRLYGLYGKELKHPEQLNALSSCCMKLYKASLMNKAVFYNAKAVANAEDTLFNIFTLNHKANIVYLDKCYYHYRRTNQSSLTSTYRGNYSTDIYQVFRIMTKHIADQNLGEDYRISINNRIVFNTFSVVLNETESGSISESISKIRMYLHDRVFQEACSTVSWKELTIPWKAFYIFCRMKLAYILYTMVYVIKKIRR